MKKKLLILGALLAAFVALGALATPPKARDVQIVKGIEPFTIETTPQFATVAEFVHRRYSLHMSYDDAVKLVRSELVPKGWNDQITYYRAVFTRAEESVSIVRGRVIDGTPEQMGGLEEMYTLDWNTPPNLPFRGWVMVDTNRAIPTMTAYKAAATGWFSKKPEARLLPYNIKTYELKRGKTNGMVNVDQGTASLESDVPSSTAFYDHGRPLSRDTGLPVN